ncbi:DNA-binding protein [Mycobacterium sp. ENV421]|nr:DNA-binding protein [Mycobacterium sp. ENV421]
MRTVSESDLAKVSEAAELCGMPIDVLKMMAADGLLPQVVRGKTGHVYFPRSAIPTWTECVELLREQRDRHLRRAASALRRLDTELEAVRNDITEAREYPHQTLGIDLMSFGHWPHDRMASTLRGQPLITGVLEQFTTERIAITRYHDAYLDALASEGRQAREDTL